MISHAPFPSPAQLTMCPPANHTHGEKGEGGEGGREEREEGNKTGAYRMSSQPVSPPRKQKKKKGAHVRAIIAIADNELHTDDHMTRWRLCVIRIVRDRRQRQSAEQTPGLMRECLLCNTSQTQQHLFFYSGLSLPGSSDTKIPC